MVIEASPDRALILSQRFVKKPATRIDGVDVPIVFWRNAKPDTRPGAQ